MTVCAIRKRYMGQAVVEGAGVRLHRVFGYYEVPDMDPFLLLDDFSSDTPAHFAAGFPWHPHRGIETVTYILEGSVEHGDSLGNSGTIGSGDVQWMSAGSGIIHQEMPRGNEAGKLRGFQLWVNLPRKQKMSDPGYQEILSAAIPMVEWAGVCVRVICGGYEGVEGPARDIAVGPLYLDVELEPDADWSMAVEPDMTVGAYVFEGDGHFGPGSGSAAGVREFLRFEPGKALAAKAGGKGMRFLLLAGRPLGEPVAWRGPIVMNTQEEAQQALHEYHEGTLVKKGAWTTTPKTR